MDNKAIPEIIDSIEHVMRNKKGDYEEKFIEEYLTKPVKVSFGDRQIIVNGEDLSYVIGMIKYLSHIKRYHDSIEILSKINAIVSERLDNPAFAGSNSIYLTRFYNEMAKANYSLGKLDESIENLKIAFNVNENEDFLLDPKGSTHYEAPFEEFENSCRCASLIYFKMGDYKNSIKYSKKEIQVGENYCPLGIAYNPRLLIIVCYLLLGNSREAKKYLTEVETKCPEIVKKKRAMIDELLI